MLIALALGPLASRGQTQLATDGAAAAKATTPKAPAAGTAASGAAKPAAARKKLEPIEPLRAALASGDTAKASAALEALGARGDRAAIDALRGFLVVGQADAWADRALEALGATRSPEARPLLAQFAQHRRLAARVLAYRGIAAIAGEESDALLVQGLRDSDPLVRGLCAIQLGERNARPTVDVLLRALELGVPEAAGSIGKLGDADAVARYGVLLQRLPISVMLNGYGEFLRRADLPEATKLEIVARLGEVAGGAVKLFLQELVREGVGKGSGAFEVALRETAKRIDPAGGTSQPPTQEVKPRAQPQPQPPTNRGATPALRGGVAPEGAP